MNWGTSSQARTRGLRLLAALAALPVVMLLASSADSSADELEWRSFHSPEASFRVDVPSEVTHDLDEHWSIAGKVTAHRYAIRHPGARLDVERHVIPRVATAFLSANRLLDLARDGLVKDLGVEPDAEEEIALQGYPGRRLLYQRPDVPGPEESRLYLAKHYLYLVSAGPWDPELRTTVVDHFFDSLVICPSDPEDCDPSEQAPLDGTE